MTMSDRELIDTHNRNMEAELVHNEKVQRDRELYETTTVVDGISITFMDYSKNAYNIPGLESGPIFKKRWVRKDDR
jgi:hypothetical protein